MTRTTALALVMTVTTACDPGSEHRPDAGEDRVCDATGCTTPGAVGEECVTGDDCEGGLGCFERPGAAVTPVCMADCDMATALTCADGSACIQALNPDGTARESEVCYLGGTVAIGEPCLNGGAPSTLVCAQGSTCVVMGDTATCRVPCYIDDAEGCADGEGCEPLSPGVGFCLP